MTTSMSNEQREKVRDDIRNGATLNLPYLTMNILAATIACYGLFANSPAVIIGAMIVAMLLGPITGVALALVDGNLALLRKGLTTLFVGAVVVMMTAFLLGSIHHDIPVTNEIIVRTSPNLFDLMIALAGGAAGAYATVSPRLSIAFVGVAIATALVPPLCSARISTWIRRFFTRLHKYGSDPIRVIIGLMANRVSSGHTYSWIGCGLFSQTEPGQHHHSGSSHSNPNRQPSLCYLQAIV